MTSSTATAMMAARIQKPRSRRGGADGGAFGLASPVSSAVDTI